MRVSVKNSKGFSLVELMVVVAIIGILAAIAVPNFQRFTAKSKQSEAKSNLSALYSAERAFKAEWNSYTSSFQSIGYAPTGTLRYQHGFAADNFVIPTGFTAPTVNNSSTLAYCGQAAAPVNGCLTVTVPLNPGNVTEGAVLTDSFIAAARGDIDGDPTFDMWTINQDKTLTVRADDLNLTTAN